MIFDLEREFPLVRGLRGRGADECGVGIGTGPNDRIFEF